MFWLTRHPIAPDKFRVCTVTLTGQISVTGQRPVFDSGHTVRFKTHTAARNAQHFCAHLISQSNFFSLIIMKHLQKAALEET